MIQTALEFAYKLRTRGKKSKRRTGNSRNRTVKEKEKQNSPCRIRIGAESTTRISNENGDSRKRIGRKRLSVEKRERRGRSLEREFGYVKNAKKRGWIP